MSCYLHFQDYPNLLLKSIREMERQQETAIAELKLMLNEQSQI